jgi:hypothetical protein
LIERRYKTRDHSKAKVDTLARKFEIITQTNKQMMLYLSVLAKMVSSAKKGLVESMEAEEDKLIANVLIDIQNKEDMLDLKEQAILRDYVFYR